MKKLIMLISIVSLTWIVSSAQGIRDTTIKKEIKLPERVAKENVKELLKGDSAIAELQLVKQNLEFEKTASSAKDKIIANLNKQIGIFELQENNYKNIISQKDLQISLYENTSKQLVKDLKKEKRKNTNNKIFGGILIGGLITLLIIK